MVQPSFDRRPHGNIVLATGGYGAFVPAAIASANWVECNTRRQSVHRGQVYRYAPRRCKRCNLFDDIR